MGHLLYAVLGVDDALLRRRTALVVGAEKLVALPVVRLVWHGKGVGLTTLVARDPAVASTVVQTKIWRPTHPLGAHSAPFFTRRSRDNDNHITLRNIRQNENRPTGEIEPGEAIL